MDAQALTAGLSVSPQIMPEDIQGVKDQGFRSIICNRPDGEGSDQASFFEIAAAAKRLGLEARYIPIVAGKVQDIDAQAFEEAVNELPGPTLAYCRTGTRSATLWSLAKAETLSLADIMAATKSAGYDMGGVVRRIVNGGKTCLLYTSPSPRD